MRATTTPSRELPLAPDPGPAGLGRDRSEIPVLGARDTSGMTSKLVLAFAEHEGGPEKVDEILARAGLSHCEHELRDESSWFPYDVKIKLFEATAAAFDDPRVMRRVGESALELSVGGGLKNALRALGSPRLVYQSVVRANAKFSTVQEMRLLELDRDSARIEFLDVGGVGFHLLDCDYTAGLLSCVPAMFGQPLARVAHPVCGVKGAASCIYDVSWREHISMERTLLGVAGAGAAAVGVPALFAPALVSVGIGLAVAAAGAFVLRHGLALNRRCRQLERDLREQSDSSDRLAESLQDLAGELRLEELIEKITRNAQLAVGGKEYALLTKDESGHRCLASSGLPKPTVQALERWLAYPEGGLDEAVLVDDVALIPELALIGRQHDMPLRSFCAVPLSYRGETFGALIALANQRRTFLPRDVDMLGSYAVQAAIALTNARLFEAQERLAARDPLTGLLNRRELQEHLNREIDRCRRHGDEFSILVVDLDGFKLINDTNGHSAGDAVLQRVASVLSESVRESDLVFRMGGDEFALLLTATPDREGATTVARRIGDAISRADRRVKASHGIASWPADGYDAEALLSSADRRLYSMKGERARRLLADTVAILFGALEAKDAYTAEHTREVALLAERLGRRLGMCEDDLVTLGHAAMLHDVGKIAVRTEIRTKPAALTESEYDEIKQHTLAGVRMLERIEEFAPVLPLIRSAHERWDGAGYPDGLAGKDIPFGARVICACDAFHAMVSDRLYRAARSVEEAIDEMIHCAGTQFDPVVVDALVAEIRGDETPSDGRLKRERPVSRRPSSSPIRGPRHARRSALQMPE
jgi:diguanylate cyclase (GGDEF)-like protein/putative nucleotidyltransferase with HDIG domain